MIGVSRLCATVTGAILLLFVHATSAWSDDIGEARAFVRTLADRAITELTDPALDAGQREQKFRGLLRANFDIPAMGRSALGRYWRIATPNEQTEYLAVFEDLIVATYAIRFRDYAGENLDITNVARVASGDDAAIVVQSVIVRNVAKPIRVDWRVMKTSDEPKIVDVVIEGVSMVQTQRSEFSSVVSRNGGKVAGLIAELSVKTKTLLVNGT